jgi:plasmid stabilization system protein ParE
MRLGYHPLVQRDVSEILRHYDGISPRLGDEFWAELMQLLGLISEKPQIFHFTDRGLRRATLRRFPHHLLFREGSAGIRVIVVRHDRRQLQA